MTPAEESGRTRSGFPIKHSEFTDQDQLQKQCFSELLIADNFETAFRNIASMLGGYLRLALINMSRYYDGERPCLRSILVWNKGELNPGFAYEHIFEDRFPAVFAELKQGHAIYETAQSLNAVPPVKLVPWQKELAGYFRYSGARELLCAPIIHHGKFWGYIGSDIYQPDTAFGTAGSGS